MKAIYRFARAAILGGIALAIAPNAMAGDDLLVPASVQVKLLSNVAGYDRNLSARMRSGSEPETADELRIGILLKPRSPSSAQAAGQIHQALKEVPKVGGFSHREEEWASSDPAQVAAQVGSRHWALLYVMPGFTDEEIRQLAQTLATTNLLTVAAAASDVRQGIVLGFDLISSKPRLLVHLKQARRQGVDFSSDLLRLAEVVE